MIYTDQIIIHMLLRALSELIKNAISHQNFPQTMHKKLNFKLSLKEISCT